MIKRQLTEEQQKEIQRLAKIEIAKRKELVSLKTFVFEFCLTRYRKRVLRDSAKGKPTEQLTDADFRYTQAVSAIPRFAYIERFLENLYNCEKLLVPKSRQLVITWITMAYCLWYALTHPGSNIYVQKEKESESGFGDPLDSLGSRLEFMYDKLPEEFKDKNYVKIKSPPTLFFKDHNSAIMGLAQGPDQVRGKAGSIIVVDEAAFHRELGLTLATMMPIAESGCQLILVSTANGKEAFYDTLSDGGRLC